MDLVLYLAMIPALGVLSQWVAFRTRLPGILLLLGMGILLGQFQRFDDLIAERTGGQPGLAGPGVLFPIVSLSVAVILFEGGLSLRFREFRQAGRSVVRLITVGSGVTLLLSALAARWILGFDFRISLLLGAVLVVTGPTVITPLLRQIRPSSRVTSVLKWEGIVIDPVGAILAVLVFEELLIGKTFSANATLMLLGKTLGVGLLLGAAGAWFLVQNMKRYWLPDHLHGILALALALLLFSVSNHLAEESGLITVTFLGLLLANQKSVAIEHIIEFKEHLQVLLIGCLFIVLGSRLDLQAIWEIGLPGIGFLLALIFVVRPVSVFIATIGTRLSWPERTFVAFLAPRGIVAAAVASVFALKLSLLSHESNTVVDGKALESVTFLVILGSVLFYGLSAAPLARWLGVAQPNPQGLLIVGADPWIQRLALTLQQAGVKLLLCDTNYRKISQAKQEGLEADCINIVSDHALEEIDFSGVGRLLAMTPNDEVNALAVQQFRGIFGSQNTFQMATKNLTANTARSLSQHLRGRSLFADDLTWTRIDELIDAGAKFKSTTISEEFGIADLYKLHGEGTLLLFTVSASGIVAVNTEAKPLKPVAGETVVSLVSGS